MSASSNRIISNELKIRKLVKSIIQEVYEDQNQKMIGILKGMDYSTINGLSYHLKECGCDSTMGYKDGNYTLTVRRDLLPLAIDSLKNTCDGLGQLLGEKLERKYFKK